MASEKTCSMVGHRRRQGGFTLVEVMVALGILAFGILAIASMQTSSLGGTNLAASTTEATTRAMDRLERLMPLAYTHADLSDGDHPPITDGRFTIRWNVATGTGLLTNTKTIAVTVQWNEKGAPKTSTLTYIKMDII
jgi:prepilin-type N-terminal cleavage/methylation domain-containing protein